MLANTSMIERYPIFAEVYAPTTPIKSYGELQDELAASEDAYQAVLEAEHGDRARQVRCSLAGTGEPGSAIRAAWDRYRDAFGAVNDYEANLPGGDEHRGCRPRRSVLIDHTGGRL